MKPPQERKTKKRHDNRGHPGFRLGGSDKGVSIGFERESGYVGGTIRGRRNVESLRDWCDAWLEAGEESD